MKTSPTQIDAASDGASGASPETKMATLLAENARLKGEVEELRKLFPPILEALRNGSACMSTCSLEFLKDTPNEVRLVVNELYRQSARLSGELEKAKASCAVKDEALKRIVELGNSWEPGHRATCMQDEAKAALQPNCGTALLKEVQELRVTAKAHEALLQEREEFIAFCQSIQLSTGEVGPIQVAKSHIDRLRAELEDVKRERNERMEGLRGLHDEELQRRLSSQAALERARVALERYGRHEEGCHCIDISIESPCSCGFCDALETP